MSTTKVVSCHVEFDVALDNAQRLSEAAWTLLDTIEKAQNALLEVSSALTKHTESVNNVQAQITRVRTPNI
jgi:hypothetical protein